MGIGYISAVPVKGKKESTTYSAIADSIITMTKEKTDKEISHDTANALHTLSEIFDKKKIEERHEYVNILSQVGFHIIGDIAEQKEKELHQKAEKARRTNNNILAENYEKEAETWKESGAKRIALHGIMGALVSQEAGDGIQKGMTGAGLNALLQKRLEKIQDPEVHKMASAAIGYLTGGKTGAAIAEQATIFNYLTHEQYELYLNDIKNAKTEEDRKQIQRSWEVIDEKQRYLTVSIPGTYWDLKLGQSFTIKEGESILKPVFVTAARTQGETLFVSAVSSGINIKVGKYIRGETAIGDAFTLPWDIVNDANINKYGIQGAKRRIGIDVYGNLILVPIAMLSRGNIREAGGIMGAVGMSELKEKLLPPLTENERKRADENYFLEAYEGMD